MAQATRVTRPRRVAGFACHEGPGASRELGAPSQGELFHSCCVRKGAQARRHDTDGAPPTSCSTEGLPAIVPSADA